MDDSRLAPRPLFISGEADTGQQLRALAAAAGVHFWQAHDAVAAREYWAVASAVVVGADAVHSCLEAKLPPRPGVVLLTGAGLDVDGAWPLAQRLGADQVASLPHAAGWLTERLTPDARPVRRGRMIAVTGGRGGVGASTLSAALAVHASRKRWRTILVDADSRGGGIDITLGWERLPGLRWSDLVGAAGPYDPHRLPQRLPGEAGLRILTFNRDHTALPDLAAAQSAVEAARLGADLVIVDLPRHAENWARSAVRGGDLLTVVVPGEVRAIAAARQVIAGHSGVCGRVGVVLRSPSPGGLTSKAVLDTIGAPLTAEWRRQRRIARNAETRGLARLRSRDRLSKVCESVLASLEAVPTPVPQQVLAA